MAHTHYYFQDTPTDNQIQMDQLEIIYTGFLHNDPNFKAELHSHDFCEILFVLSGNGNIAMDGVTYPIKQGDLIVVNPGVLHCESSAGNGKLHLIFLGVSHFQVGTLPENHLIGSDLPPVIAAQVYRYKIESFFTDIISESTDKITLYTTMSKNLTCALLILILRLYHSRTEQVTDLKEECRRIKDYIDKNYTSPITLDSLSEQVYISKYYLSHIFKAQTGTSPIKYLIHKRISTAANLLLNTDLSIREIALQVGYDDPVYFSQIFKKVMEISPAAYRAEHKE